MKPSRLVAALALVGTLGRRLYKGAIRVLWGFCKGTGRVGTVRKPVYHEGYDAWRCCECTMRAR